MKYRLVDETRLLAFMTDHDEAARVLIELSSVPHSPVHFRPARFLGIISGMLCWIREGDAPCPTP